MLQNIVLLMKSTVVTLKTWADKFSLEKCKLRYLIGKRIWNKTDNLPS